MSFHQVSSTEYRCDGAPFQDLWALPQTAGKFTLTPPCKATLMRPRPPWPTRQPTFASTGEWGQTFSSVNTASNSPRAVAVKIAGIHLKERRMTTRAALHIGCRKSYRLSRFSRLSLNHLRVFPQVRKAFHPATVCKFAIAGAPTPQPLEISLGGQAGAFKLWVCQGSVPVVEIPT